MLKYLRVLIGLVTFLLLSGTAAAQAPHPLSTDPTWWAVYYNTMNLSGPVAWQGQEGDINFDWGQGAPNHPGVNADNFSVRWSRNFDLPAGNYRFTTTSDDGNRVFVDGRLVLDAWRDWPVGTHNGDITLSAGTHLIVVDYCEATGNASMHFAYKYEAAAPVPPPSDAWHADYFNSTDLSGPVVQSRDYGSVDFHWEGQPEAGVNSDYWSARFTRNLNLSGGTYWFTVKVDDGARLWVNNNLLIDQWHDQTVSTYTASIYLSGGTYPVRLEYYDRTGGAWITLSWSTSAPSPVINNWRGDYFNNTSLSGSPALTRDDGSINFNWGTGSPDGAINSDNFSVRWTRNLYFSAGTYYFTVSVDDGARLWVNGNLLIDQWHDQALTTYTASIYLSDGTYPVELDYYERTDKAYITLNWSTSAPSPVISNWRGDYFNNKDLSGSPTLTRDDGSINFNWGTGSPDPSINSDYFSVRWTRNLNLSAGTYYFTVSTDDGARLWVNGNLLIDQWHDQALTTYTASIYLSGGSIPIELDYYERTDKAYITLNWSTSAPAPVISNWRGEYYNNTSLSGSPALVRDDPSINFDWGYGSPDPSISADTFSVRWTRNVNFTAGTYRFTSTMDDGVRLWVNNQLVLDDWTVQAPNTNSVDVYVPSGAIPVRFEYFENTGRAVAQLSWAPVSAPAPQPGTVLVDDGDPGFKWGGLSSTMYRAFYGWGGDLFWTRNDDWARSGYNWAAWYPNLNAGTYEVFAHIPAQSGATHAARYWVYHAGGKTMHVVDQNGSVARWDSLGIFSFQGTSGDYVTLSDVTGETFLSHIVTWDAMKWEPR